MKKATKSREEFIVYYVDDKPNCAWHYHHNPKDGMPEYDEAGNKTGRNKGYGRLYGYWNSKGKFVEHTSTNLKIMDYKTFKKRVIPDIKKTKKFKSVEEFLLELI